MWHDSGLSLVRLLIPRPAVAGLMLAIGIGTSACAETFDARTLGTRTTLSARATQQPQGEPFRISKTAVWVLWGAVSASRPSLDRVLSTQVVGDAEIANLRVTAKSRFGDVLVTALTGGLVVPRTIVYEGIIVKPEAAPATGTP
jgi:hypothetical protein